MKKNAKVWRHFWNKFAHITYLHNTKAASRFPYL
jgi:hypothetical protein